VFPLTLVFGLNSEGASFDDDVVSHVLSPFFEIEKLSG
jgi:hypothetical protein